MKTKLFKVIVLAFVLMCCGMFIIGGSTQSDGGETPNTGVGDPDVVYAAYNKWEAEFVRTGGDRNLVLPLNWSKGLSDEFTRASGEAKFDLIDGKVSVRIGGLSKKESWDFWMIDDNPGEGNSVMPDADDVMIRVGSLTHNGKTSELEADLGSDAFASFDIDTIVVTRAGKDPTQERFLVGYTSAFYALYRSGQRGHFGRIEGWEPEKPAIKKDLFARLIDALSPRAHAQVSPAPPEIIDLVAFGRKVFFEEKFQGNTRTCGSCHREDNNLTIDPVFIAKLGPFDALFVAEFQEPLFFNFEKPPLMRGVGLILENVDGFDNLAKKFAMRGVPHTLGLNLTLNNGGVPGFAEATGWSGDGSPGNDENFILGDGSLHVAKGGLFEFAIGAVRQHFPKTLARIPSGGGVEGDFRFPTRLELIALELFQRSTGRQAELSLPLNLKSPLALAGQNIFINGNPGSVNQCNACHFNAGANFAGTDINGNVDTNAEDLPLTPGKLIDPTIPRDGGFGTNANPNGGFGDDTFNIAPVVEAPDTPPFFHNNAVLTVEGSVDFYDGQLGFNLDVTEVQAIAAFMRVLNALENIRSAVAFEVRAKTQGQQAASLLLDLSIADLQDGIEVLNTASLHPDAALLLGKAIELDQRAKTIANQAQRNQVIDAAILLKNQARGLIIN
jgi:hypothetical protein